MGRRKKKLAQVLPELIAVYRYFWQDIRKQRSLMIGSMGALLVSVVFRLLEPWPLKFVLDRAFRHSNSSIRESGTLLESLTVTQLLIVVCVSVVFIAVMRAVTDYLSRVGFFIAGNRVVVRIRDRVYRHLQQLPLAFHTRARSGDLIIRVTRDVSLLRDVTATAILPLIASVLVLSGMVGVMFWLQWKLALVSVAIIPLFWLSTVRLGRRIRETTRKQRQREGAMASIASEVINAIGSVKALSLEEKFAEDFGRRNWQSQKDDLKAGRLSLRLGRTIDVLLAIATSIVLWFGAKMVFSGSISPGDLVVFLVYLKRAFKPTQEFAKYAARITKATASGERVIEVLNEAPEPECSAGDIDAGQIRGELRFKNVSFGYDRGTPILNKLNLNIAAGESVAIVGPSGAGKSTLLSLVMRLYDPSDGQLQIDGIDSVRYSIGSLRSNMSVVLQDPLLFAGSIRENIAIGNDDATLEDVLHASRIARVDEFVDRLPAGYDTYVGERGATLSRGQAQRIAIARAAMRSSPILLMDEPTTGLDETNERIVCQALADLASQRTTILVTHNMRLAAQADRIVYIDKGTVQQQGAHSTLMTQKGPYTTLLRQRSDRNRPLFIANTNGSRFSANDSE